MSKFKNFLAWTLNPIGEAITRATPHFGKKHVSSNQWLDEYNAALEAGQIPSSMSYDVYQKKYHPMNVSDKIDAKLGTSSLASDVKDVAVALKDNLTGDTALKVQHDSQEFNAYQAQVQREWDSISKQTERAQAAGYNPVAAMIAQNGGIGQSTGSPASSGSVGAPTANIMDVYGHLPNSVEALTGIGGFVGSMAKSALDYQNAEDVVATRKARIAELMARADNLHKQTELCGANLVTQNKLNEWYDVFKEVELAGMRAENMNKREQRKFIKAQTHLTNEQAKSVNENLNMAIQRFNESLPREMRLLDSELDLNHMKLNDIISEINLRACSAALTASQTQGQDIDNAFNAKTFDDAVLKFHNEMTQTFAEAGISLKDYAYYMYNHGGIIGKVSGLGTQAGGSFGRLRKQTDIIQNAESYMDMFNP